MLRLFRAGAVAACLQCVLILLITPLVLAGWRYGMNVQRFPDADPMDTTMAASLEWSYLVIATGAALTTHRSIDITARNIRRASRLMRPSEPDEAAHRLLVMCWFAAFGCAGLALYLRLRR
jgi:TRAP-type C4-dicarboxylate transport system permease small subunit